LVFLQIFLVGGSILFYIFTLIFQDLAGIVVPMEVGPSWKFSWLHASLASAYTKNLINKELLLFIFHIKIMPYHLTFYCKHILSTLAVFIV